MKTAEEFILEISKKSREEVNALSSIRSGIYPTAYNPIIFRRDAGGYYAVYINQFGMVETETLDDYIIEDDDIDDYLDERLWVRSNPIFYNELKELLTKDDEEKEKEND